MKNRVIVFLLLLLSPTLSFAASEKPGIFVQLLVSWAPFIVLIGVWVWFMLRAGNKSTNQEKYLERGIEHMEKVEKILTKISEQLEVSNSKKE